MLIVATVIVVVIIAIVAVVLAVRLSPKADLRAELYYDASNDDFGMLSSGTITVYGTIYNYGDKMGDGTVELRIYDGYEWHDYDVPTGAVPANGSVDFFWMGDFNPMNEYEVEVEYGL